MAGYTTCRYTNQVYSQLPDIVVYLCLHYIDANQMMIKDMNHGHTCLQQVEGKYGVYA